MKQSHTITILIIIITFCVYSVALSSSTRTSATGLTNSSTQPATSTQNKDITGAENVLQKLLEQEPPITPPINMHKKKECKKKISVKKQPVRFTPFTAKTKNKQKLLPEGYYIADRRGRLIITKNYPVFVFESDGKVMADPPIKLLPNRWLEKMESDVSASPVPVIFRISGEVTCYHNQNFLLLRKVLIDRGAGIITK